MNWFKKLFDVTEDPEFVRLHARRFEKHPEETCPNWTICRHDEEIQQLRLELDALKERIRQIEG
jgi:hypothetical protein